MSNLSVVILTYNEELHIQRCIESVLPITKNIFVVDSFSTDNTVEICKSLGATVFQRAWKNYADQFQWGLDNCPIETTWVMRLDADEHLDATMQQALPTALATAPASAVGFNCYLRNIFMGRRIRFGGYDPLNLLRIWRTGSGRIESRWMDEHIVLDEGQTFQASGEILHNNLNNHRWWTDKHNKYADREMIDILNKRYNFFGLDTQPKKSGNKQAKIKRLLKEKIYNHLPLFVRPTLYFAFRYILCLGFLDAKEGFAYHFFQAYWYRSVVDVRVFEAERLLENATSNEERLELLEKLTGLKLK